MLKSILLNMVINFSIFIFVIVGVLAVKLVGAHEEEKRRQAQEEGKDNNEARKEARNIRPL